MMAENSPISLPRTLVNLLLRAAQLHPSQVRWGIISSREGNPEQCYPMNGSPRSETQAYGRLQETLSDEGEQVWALYCSAPADSQASNADEVARFNAPRFLGISLGTKGVLQLRGWQIEDGQLWEREVAVRED
ncbi:MAG: hypothetical protein WBR29_09280 [Gammaproteobacteria bacterium]